MAAGTADPALLPLATVTKLARVALLPVVLLALPWTLGGAARRPRAAVRIPGFVIGFLLVSVAATLLAHGGATLAAVWSPSSRIITWVSTLMLASAMTAIGALVDWRALRRSGARPIALAVMGAIVLAGDRLDRRASSVVVLS